MKANKLKSFLAFAFFSATVFSQKNAEKGDKYFSQNIFDEAIKCYQLDVKGKNSKVMEYAMQKLADCYRITGEFEKAEIMYKKVLKKKKNKKNPECILNYALSLKSSAKYAEASEQFREYVQLKPEDPMGTIYLSSCDSAQRWLDETIGKEVKNIEGINTSRSDFCPVLLPGGELYFTSSRNGSTEPIISFNGGTEIERTDVYKTSIALLSGHNKNMVANLKGLNSSGHEGAMCFTHDGNEVYFTKTIKGKREKHSNTIVSTLQVFYSKKDSTGKWIKPASAFSFNSPQYSVGHPSLSNNDSIIYFMSDKPGGYGKTDIYYSVKQSTGKWGPPVNAGKAVNTFGYELFPFIAANNDLYFASNAHPGMGQLDLFRSIFSDNTWNAVQNLKPPLNSIGNDFGIVMDATLHHGFFSSDRFNGKGQEDIYSFSEENPIEIFLTHDTIRFADKSIFDDIQFKLKPDTGTQLTDLKARDGVFLIRLKEGSACKIIAKKNGFTYNTFCFILKKDSDGGKQKVIFSSDSKDYIVKGPFAPVPVYETNELSFSTGTINEPGTDLFQGDDQDTHDGPLEPGTILKPKNIYSVIIE
jgi:hypothetical protein